MAKKKRPLKKWLTEYMPTFCWQTKDEIMGVLELLDEDVSEDSVIVTLYSMCKEGIISRRTITNKHQFIDKCTQGGYPTEFIKNERVDIARLIAVP